ncbi:fatty acid cis/trans isomerase, partial [Pseudomonas syringae]
MPLRLLASVALLFICCAAQAQNLRSPATSAPPAISYVQDIQPILTEKCVACHACNDAPCQLNLGSGEGLSRGASKIPVYQGERSETVAPTRLFYDARNTDAWRGKGFYSVLEAQGGQAALMARMLDLGRSAPLPANSKIPDEIALGLNRENVCPLPGEFSAY